MAALLILRTVVTQVLRQPLFWLLGALLVAAWWGLEVFMPLGLSTDQLHRSTAHYELAFLAGAVAQGMALGPCLKLRWVLRERGSWWGVGIDVLALTAVAALLGCTILVPAEAFQLWQFADFNATASLAALIIGWLHLATMAAAFPLRSSPGDDRRSFRDTLGGMGWIAFAVVIIPAVSTGRSPHGRALLHLLDPGRMLRSTFAGAHLETGDWVASWIPVVAWSLLAAGLSHRAATAPSVPASSPHALRHPR